MLKKHCTKEILDRIGDDIGNLDMVDEYIVHKGEIIWILNDKGNKYIFSDQRENEDEEGANAFGQGFITECVPFKNYALYIQIYDGGYQVFAWYSKEENYCDCYADWNKCLAWLVDGEV